SDPDISDWVVLHSLGLATRATGPYGEIDFVLLAPCGAVICLEVKGGRVSCLNGVWMTTDRFGTCAKLKKSPFMQAREAMFSLMRAVQARFGVNSDTGRCLFCYAVVFPDVNAPPQTPEFEKWEAIGRQELQFPISKLLQKLISTQRKKIGTHNAPQTSSSV